MKTREELEEEGTLLEGDIVPDWFKWRSDKCSVPGRFMKWGLRAEVYAAGCYIHDWDYYKTNIIFEPGSKEWRGSLKMADLRLKRNVRLIQKWPVRSKLHGFLYYAGVRIGGRKAARKKSKIEDIWMPPTKEDIQYLRTLVVSQFGRTKRSSKVFGHWAP